MLVRGITHSTLPPFWVCIMIADYLGTSGTRPADSALERRHRLLESLNFAQIDARKTTIRAAHAKTYRWLLRTATYRNWLDSSKLSESHGFLWMRGKAGAGKSTLMKFLCSASKKSDKPGHALTASFFFNARGDYLEKSIAGMYRSLLMQLLKGFSDLQTILDDTDVIPQGQQDCPDLNVLKEIFERAAMALGPRSLTCFIDALDECDEQEVRDMVQFFEDLAETTTTDGIKLRICFSSRPYPYISIRKGILFTLEDEPGHAEDLAQYVKSKLTIDDPLILADLQTEILGKASGIFLWIVLAVDILNRENDDGGLALRTKLAKIPARLSDLFKRMLMRDQKSPERLLLCVLWILCAKRPLTPAQFRHAMWVGLLDQSPQGKDTQVDSEVPDVTNMNACIKLVTSSSKGLAEITKSKQPTVQFVHESVRDYLVKERGLLDLWPDLGFEWEALGHERLRRCCAAYLDLDGIRTALNQVDRKTDRDALVQKYTLLEYASQQILHHADAAAPVSPQDDFLSRFFTGSSETRLLNMFERHNTRKYSPGATPLYILADKGLGNLVRTRMKTEPDAYCPHDEYRYPFFAALAGGHKDTVAALLQIPSVHCDGADITEGFKYRKDLERYKGRTPLSWAAQEGKLGLAKALAQADLNARDRDGFTPLSRAVGNGHEDRVKLIITRGANPNNPDSDGSTALGWGSEEGHESIVQVLLEAGAHVNAPDVIGWTALMIASQTGHESIVRRLIEAGALVNARMLNGWTALLAASGFNHESVVKCLLDNGADVNLQSFDGWTALMRASTRGHESVAQLLTAGGADVNFRGSGGMTALILASKSGHEAIVRLLLSSGAHVNVQDSQGETALTQAHRNGHESVAQLLIDNGADCGS